MSGAAKLCPCGKPAKRKYCSKGCCYLFGKRPADIVYRAANREKIRATHKAWRDRNPEKVKGYSRKTLANGGRDRDKAYRATHRDEISSRNKARYRAAAEERKAKSRAYYWANRERVLVKAKLWAAQNRERLLKKSKAYRDAHKAEMKAWRAKNADRLREWQRDYNRKNKDTILATQKKNYRIRNAEKIAARQKAKLARMSPEMKKARNQKYNASRAAARMKRDFALLTVAASARASTNSAKPAPTSPAKN